jgi:branched-chain amino acid transport system permease protein
MVTLLYAFLELTLLGKAVLATAANRLAAHLVGSTRGPYGAGLRRIGRHRDRWRSDAPITLTSYDVGTLLALKGFAAAMLGHGKSLELRSPGILIGR